LSEIFHLITLSDLKRVSIALQAAYPEPESAHSLKQLTLSTSGILRAPEDQLLPAIVQNASTASLDTVDLNIRERSDHYAATKRQEAVSLLEEVIEKPTTAVRRQFIEGVLPHLRTSDYERLALSNLDSF